MQLLVKPLNNILSVFKEFKILKSDLVLFSIWKAEPEDLEWAGGTTTQRCCVQVLINTQFQLLKSRFAKELTQC